MFQQEFFINTIPQAQARARFARMGNFVKTYDPKKCKDYKADVRYQVMYASPVLMEGPLTMIVDFWMPRPKAHYGAKGLKEKAPSFHTSKPDIDNMLKGIFDAVRGVLWKDDTQVAVCVATKKYGETTGIKIVIQEAQ